MVTSDQIKIQPEPAEVYDETIPFLRMGVFLQNELYKFEKSYLSGHLTIDTVNSELDNTWDQINHNRKWCSEKAWADRSAGILCAKYGGIAGHLMKVKLSWQETIQWIEDGIAAAQRWNLREDLPALLTHLAFLHFMNRNQQRAMTLNTKALEISESNNNKQGKAAVLTHFGMFYHMLDQPDLARKYLREAVRLFQEIEDLKGVAKCLNALGECSRKLSKPEEALAHYEQALEYTSKNDEPTLFATLLANKGSILTTKNRIEEARRCLERAKELGEYLKDDGVLALALVRLSVIQTADTDPQERSKGIASLENALRHAQANGDKEKERGILHRLSEVYRSVLKNGPELTYSQKNRVMRKSASVYHQLNNMEKTRETWFKVFNDAVTAGELPDQLEALGQLGRLHMQDKKYKDAYSYHGQALALLKKMRTDQNDPTLNQTAECEILLSLGQVQRHLGELGKAESSYNRALVIARAKGHKDAEIRSNGNLGLIYAESKKFPDALQMLEEVVSEYEEKSEYTQTAVARFNLAYGYFLNGETPEAKQLGKSALTMLERINHPDKETMREQMASWG